MDPALQRRPDLPPPIESMASKLNWLRAGVLGANDGLRGQPLKTFEYADYGFPGAYSVLLIGNGIVTAIQGIAQEELDRSSGFWWSPDGARLVTVGEDATTRVWSATSGAHPCR